MLLFKEERDFRLLEAMALRVWKQALLLAPGSADLPCELIGFTYNKKKGDAETMANYFPDRSWGKLWTWLANFAPTSILSKKRESGSRVFVFLLIADHQWVFENPGKVARGFHNPTRRLGACTHKLRHRQGLPSSKGCAWMLQLACAFTSEGLCIFQATALNVSKEILNPSVLLSLPGQSQPEVMWGPNRRTLSSCTSDWAIHCIKENWASSFSPHRMELFHLHLNQRPAPIDHQ